MDHVLFGQVNDKLHRDTQVLASSWGSQPALPGLPLDNPCDQGAFRFNEAAIWACYDTRGNYLNASVLVRQAALRFVTDTLARTAVGNRGDAIDTIDVGGSLGRIRRYAAIVTDSQGNALGVIQVGEQVGTQEHALQVLLLLLVIVGGLAVVFAAVGGLLLGQQALRPARLAYARQRDFIADASHELRTPLTLMRADAEVLLRNRQRLDPDDAAIIEDVVSEAVHMSSLANNMLNLARLDSGTMPIDHEVIDLAALAGETVRRIGPLAGEKGVSLAVNGSTPVLVVGDRLLLEQTALILCDNAIKYNHAGGTVTVTAGTRVDRALLTVEDTGIGIAAEHLPHLGERFYRVDRARSREMGGAGLGVSIARTIAARHGGSLELSSRPGEGTSATLNLPLARLRDVSEDASALPA